MMCDKVRRLEREIKDVVGKGCLICGDEKKGLLCACKTVRYCSRTCQRIDWSQRGHKSVCRKIRDREAAAKLQAERDEAAAQRDDDAPEELVFYGPAPRSRADEARARIRAEHEAARVLREAEPERDSPLSARYGSRCPICLEDWDVNDCSAFLPCCVRQICQECSTKTQTSTCCPLCRASGKCNQLEILNRHVTEKIPEAVLELGCAYDFGHLGLKESPKRAKKLYEEAIALGAVVAMWALGNLLWSGRGVKINRKKAKKLFRMAADRGHAEAQDAIGRMLHKGQEFEAGDSVEEGVRYLALAAKQGYTPAEYSLGVCYQRGSGVELDLGKSRFWYSRAAAKGNEPSKRALEHDDFEDDY